MDHVVSVVGWGTDKKQGMRLRRVRATRDVSVKWVCVNKKGFAPPKEAHFSCGFSLNLQKTSQFRAGGIALSNRKHGQERHHINL